LLEQVLVMVRQSLMLLLLGIGVEGLEQLMLCWLLGLLSTLLGRPLPTATPSAASTRAFSTGLLALKLR